MAEPFCHYMYVLECEDGSLYTGYSPDVQARLAAHRKGQGARYTKTHRPRRLVAQARFYTKRRALSAEAHFKQLSRPQKDRLLAQAAYQPLEEVLAAQLPGFASDTACELVARSLCQAQKPSLKAFNSKLLPGVDKATILGVPTPQLRSIAKRLMAREDAQDFLGQLPHGYFEENLIQALALGLLGSYEETLAALEAFLPYVDNWAVSDQIPLGSLQGHRDQLAEPVEAWLSSGRCYSVRLGIRVLMRYFLKDPFDAGVLQRVAEARLPQSPKKPPAALDFFYVDKARAWFFAEALAAQPQATLPYLEPDGPLDAWTRRAAIQKVRESRKVPDHLKAYLGDLQKRR